MAASREGTLPPDQEAHEAAIPPKYRIRRFLEFQLRTVLDVFIKTRKQFFTVNFTPESLQALELLLPRSPDEWTMEALPYLTQQGFSSQSLMWLIHMEAGSYLGEVLVRNLHGRWRYPNRLLALIALVFNWPGIVYRHWYVIVRNQKVPVFELARRRETMGPKESLMKAYDAIAHGYFTIPKSPGVLSREGRKQFFANAREQLRVDLQTWRRMVTEKGKKQLLTALFLSVNMGLFISLSAFMVLWTFFAIRGGDSFVVWLLLFAFSWILTLRNFIRRTAPAFAWTRPAVLGERRFLVVTSVALSSSLAFDMTGSGYDMILTNRRFIFTDRKIAEAGFAADGDGMATQYSFTLDLETLARKQGSICLPFRDLRRVQTINEGKGNCQLSIDCRDTEGRKQTLRIECQFKRDWRGTRYKYPDYTMSSNTVSAAYNKDCADFLQSIENALRTTLPPSVALDLNAQVEGRTESESQHSLDDFSGRS